MRQSFSPKPGIACIAVRDKRPHPFAQFGDTKLEVRAGSVVQFGCHGFAFFHRAAAAFFAMALRLAALNEAALAGPPARPPERANSWRSSSLRAFIEALPPSGAIRRACSRKVISPPDFMPASLTHHRQEKLTAIPIMLDIPMQCQA